jgi:hypothetical protein
MVDVNEGSAFTVGELEQEVLKGDEIDAPIRRISIIEDMLLKEEVLAFDPMVFSVLDNSNASQKEIEDLKVKLGPDLFNHLFSIANSAYHGSLKMGRVRHFFDVVTRLGMEHTKVAILMFAMRRLARGDMEAELLYVKSFAASVVGRTLARGLGFSDNAARKVELGCLIFHFGFLMMLVYRSRHQDEEFHIDDDFITKYRTSLTERMICRFGLPDYLLEMIMTRCLSIDRMGVKLSGVVQMAIAIVEMSFQRFNNRLVVQSPMPSSDDGVTITLGSIIDEQFSAAGLRQYLQIVTQPSQISEGYTA